MFEIQQGLFFYSVALLNRLTSSRSRGRARWSPRLAVPLAGFRGNLVVLVCTPCASVPQSTKWGLGSKNGGTGISMYQGWNYIT